MEERILLEVEVIGKMAVRKESMFPFCCLQAVKTKELFAILYAIF
jgi:hypothetical protein